MNEAENELVAILRENNITLPTVGTLTQLELMALARVYRSTHKTFLCYRLNNDSWLSKYDNDKLLEKIHKSLGNTRVLTLWIDNNGGWYGRNLFEYRNTVRDVWIIDMMTENGTTIEQMLLLSRKWKFRLFRWFL